MNSELNKRFHKFLTDTGQMDDKADVVEAITNGRSRSSKDLTDMEVRVFLTERQTTKNRNHWTPKGGDECDRKRKKIIAIFKSVGLGVDRVKEWAKNLNGFGKEFNDYTSEELSKIISIAEREKHKIIKQFKPII